MIAYFRLLLLGAASGLPLSLSASTLFAWLSDAHVSKESIGLFAALGLPYALKFLWAPLVDQGRLPALNVLGRRRSWMILAQSGIMVVLLLISQQDPAQAPWRLAFYALCLSFFSATLDIVLDAYRVESLPPEKQGTGAAWFVLGYRFGMMASGAGALALAQWYDWMAAYQAMCVLALAGFGLMLLCKEPGDYRPPHVRIGEGLWQRLCVAPWRAFAQTNDWKTLITFIILFKLADVFIGVMTNPFLLEIGFRKDQIAVIVKLYGMGATIAGGFLGGFLVKRMGLVRTLFITGVAHAATNLLFYVQAGVGPREDVLAIVIGAEYLTGGMGTTAFVALLSRLCQKEYTATQYALLSALASLGRTVLSTPAGWVAAQVGWEVFFVISSLLAIPSLLLLLLRRKSFPH